MTLAGARVVIAVTAPRSAAFLTGQLAVLRAAGAEAFLLTSPSDEVAAQCASEGATYLPIAMERGPDPAGDVRALAEILRNLRRVRPMLVNAGTPKAGLLVMTAARALGVPVRVQTLHGLRFEAAHGLARAALWTAQRLSCAAATHVVCVSPSLRDRARTARLFRQAHVIGDGTANGIDLTRFSRRRGIDTAASELRARFDIAPEAPVIGYVGRLARDKGLSVLADAWPRLADTGAHLLIAGELDQTDLPDEGVLARLEASPRVHLLGFVDPVPVYAALDVLALPTYREGMPTAPLEAGALGVPTVASRVTGCVDAVVDGVTGALVDAHHADQLADALRRYIDDPPRRARHGEAARARIVEQFGRDRVQVLTVAWYQQLLERP